MNEQTTVDSFSGDINTFVTETDLRYVKQQSCKGVALTFVVFSLFACLGFLVAWQTFVFFEVIVIVACIATLFSKIRNDHDYELRFENDRLYVVDRVNGTTEAVFDVPASGFVINQTKKERQTDYCSLLIKNTVLTFGGVKKCRELKAYISHNFK